MREIVLGVLVVIGIFVCWCDLTGAWNNVLRPIREFFRLNTKWTTINDFRSGSTTGRKSFQKEERAREVQRP